MNNYVFKTSDSTLNKYNGKTCRIVKEITEPDDTHDAEVLPMYVIEFQDGLRTDCFPDEISNETKPSEITRPLIVVDGGEIKTIMNLDDYIVIDFDNLYSGHCPHCGSYLGEGIQKYCEGCEVDWDEWEEELANLECGE